MKYSYQAVYNKNAAFLKRRPRAKKALPIFDWALTIVFASAYLALWVYGIFWGAFGIKDFIRISFIPLTTFFLVCILREVIARPRPYAEDGAGITPIKTKKSDKKDSFPSRHLACAVAIAVCFFPALPILGVGLLILCVLFAYVRFALGVHYPSDLLAGASVGSLIFALYHLLEYVFTLLS